jgi:hypothetical protein
MNNKINDLKISKLKFEFNAEITKKYFGKWFHF